MFDLFACIALLCLSVCVWCAMILFILCYCLEPGPAGHSAGEVNPFE
jgi:hypothetical protein